MFDFSLLVLASWASSHEGDLAEQIINAHEAGAIYTCGPWDMPLFLTPTEPMHGSSKW